MVEFGEGRREKTMFTLWRGLRLIKGEGGKAGSASRNSALQPKLMCHCPGEYPYKGLLKKKKVSAQGGKGQVTAGEVQLQAGVKKHGSGKPRLEGERPRGQEPPFTGRREESRKFEK